MAASVHLTTDRQISALRPAAASYEMRIGGSRGLSLRVYPSSFKQFELRYLTGSGKRRRLVLGLWLAVRPLDPRRLAPLLEDGEVDLAVLSSDLVPPSLHSMRLLRMDMSLRAVGITPNWAVQP